MRVGATRDDIVACNVKEDMAVDGAEFLVVSLLEEFWSFLHLGSDFLEAA
jgi:hypothetical protein